MADEPEAEVIHRQMEAQRAALAQKLETLEKRIVDTVEGAREAVAETVQTVKDGVKDSVATVKDTVQTSVASVKETLDLPLQVERHPWAMFGGAVAAGFVAGWFLRRAGASQGARVGAAFAAAPAFSPVQAPAAAPPVAPAPADRGPSLMDEVVGAFAPEMHKLKGLAIGTLMGVLRDAVTQSLPEPMRPQLNEIVDNITTRLGGEPVQRELLDQLLPRRHDEHPNGRHRVPQEECA